MLHESALIVPVAAADPLVAGHRLALDPSAERGVPAHVTVLYPFVPPDDITDDVIARVAEAVAGVAAFDCTFPHVHWFDDDVLWLEPTPATPFHALTAAVWSRFPEHPPYGGEIEEVIPHLTVGDRSRAGGSVTVDALRLAEQDVLPHLPLRTRIDTLHLMTGGRDAGSWHVRHSFALGG